MHLSHQAGHQAGQKASLGQERRKKELLLKLKRKLDLDKGKLTKKEKLPGQEGPPHPHAWQFPRNFLPKDEHKMLAPCRMTQGFRADQVGQKTTMLVH
jgi:hypothetical protein